MKIIDDIALSLVESCGADVPRAAATLPLVLLELQAKNGTPTADAALQTPARMCFAMATASLGFVGDDVPDLFSRHGKDYRTGRAIREAYDRLVEAPADAESP